MLNVTADQLNDLKSRGEQVAYDEYFSNALFKTFIVRVSLFSCRDFMFDYNY